MILILDFYVDEPACLGVPPYLSPYIRYSAGALVENGISEQEIVYLTVDQWRRDGRIVEGNPELVIVVAGFTVPGKYLGGKIGTVAELFECLDHLRLNHPGAVTVIGGPVQFASSDIVSRIEQKGGVLIKGDMESAVAQLAGKLTSADNSSRGLRDAMERAAGKRCSRKYFQVDAWAEKGAFITRQHPNFPYLVNELETYRGCTRADHCSFCSEVFYGKTEFRSTEGIVREVRSLYNHGNRFFRLGRQPDLITYGADMEDFCQGFPKPDPYSVRKLYEEIRRVAPELKMLHLDNINPGAIAIYPREAKEILEAIVEYNTPGDTAAMGLESVDPVVFRLNGLKCDQTQAMRAIELVNEVGASRTAGIPRLLPGVNLLHGLPGENDATFERNFSFLQRVLENDLLLRRINIRQVTVHRNTRLEKLKADRDLLKMFGISQKRMKPARLENKFVYFRERIRSEIDKPMLQRVFPVGTVLREVIPESVNQGYVLGRQLGSYPVTVKIPLSDDRARKSFERGEPLDAVITGYRERSVIGMTYPVPVNHLGISTLSQIPGIGRKRATAVLLKRPLSDMDQLRRAVDGQFWGDEDDYVFD